MATTTSFSPTSTSRFPLLPTTRGPRLGAFLLRRRPSRPPPAALFRAPPPPTTTAKTRRRVRCDAAVRTIGQGEFAAEVLESKLPVLVDFVADWCGPCRLIGPAVEWASEEYEERLKIVKIDHDASAQLIEEYKVYGLPTLILFKNGQEVPESRKEGVITKNKLKEYLDSLLEPSTVA